MAQTWVGSNKKILEIFNTMKAGDLVLKPSFQRKLVWNNKHKEAFIKTILDNLPFPEVYYADGEIDLKTQRSKTLVVDGQQRLSTIYQYIIGELKVKSIKKFTDLTAEEQTRFFDYVVVVRDLGRIPEKEIIEIFKRINSVQYALNSIEIQNALYEGSFISTAKSIVKDSEFLKLETFSENESSRMLDWEYVLSIMSTLEEGGYFNSIKEIEKWIIKWEEEYPNRTQVYNEISDAIGLIIKCNFNNDSLWYRRSTIFSLIVELIKFKRKYGTFPNQKAFKSELEKLEKEILANKIQGNEFGAFYKYIYSGTASRTARISRGELLEKTFEVLK